MLVVIPVLGHHEMTHDLLRDLQRESDIADVVIVDNGGDYPTAMNEAVLHPSGNLGWAGGTNYGTAEHGGGDYKGFVWLNNDTRLSRGFIAGLLNCWRATGAGLIGPSYDCYWEHQRLSKSIPVDRYRPQSRHFHAPFLDGTCLFVPTTTIESIGLLDAETFGPVGWGADLDYGLRAHDSGLEVAVTRRAYLHHEKSVTARTAFEGGMLGYAQSGYPTMVSGLEQKWGKNWHSLAAIDPATGQTSAVTRRDRFRSPRTRARFGLKESV